MPHIGPLNSKSSAVNVWHRGHRIVDGGMCQHRPSIHPSSYPHTSPHYSHTSSLFPPSPSPHPFANAVLPIPNNPNALCGSNKMDVYYRLKIRSFLILFQFDCRAHRATTSTCGQTLFAKEIQLRIFMQQFKNWTNIVHFTSRRMLLVVFVGRCRCRRRWHFIWMLRIYEYGWFLRTYARIKSFKCLTIFKIVIPVFEFLMGELSCITYIISLARLLV